jgi:hypothetical protein
MSGPILRRRHAVDFELHTRRETARGHHLFAGIFARSRRFPPSDAEGILYSVLAGSPGGLVPSPVIPDQSPVTVARPNPIRQRARALYSSERARAELPSPKVLPLVLRRALPLNEASLRINPAGSRGTS